MNENQRHTEEYDEISLRDLVHTIAKGRKFIGIFTLAAVLIGLLGSMLMPGLLSDSKGEIKTAITYQYAGSSLGLNPRGGAFDIDEIRSPVVIKPVIDELALGEAGITVEDIRRNISFEALVPDSVVKKMDQLKDVKDDEFRIEQLDALSYNPNQFVVTFSLSKDLAMDEDTGREVLDALIRSYEGWFYTEYAKREALINIIADADFESYDYPEIVSIFRDQVDLINSNLNEKIKEDPDFRSKENGLSFQEMKEMVALIDNIELERSTSLIGAFNLTKDKDKLIKLYEYKMDQYLYVNKKKSDEMAIMIDMIDEYIKDTSAVIFASSSNSESGMSLDYEDDYYNSMVEDYATAGIESANALNEIEFIKFKINKLNEDATAPSIRGEAIIEVEQLNEEIRTRLSKWIDQINVAIGEYDKGRFYNSALKQLTPVEVYESSDVNLKLNLAISLLLGLMFSVFIVFFKSYMAEENEDQGGQEK
jgi:capsular polysaccharide biosynthesis protein